MLNFFKIASNAFKESVREPVYFLMLIAALVLIGNFPPAALFVMDESLKLVVDSSMATTLLFGLLVAVLCASHTVSREMRNGTVLLLLSKPVHRWIFISAKIAGIVAAVTVFVLICSFATVVSVYVSCDQFRWDAKLYSGFFGVIALSCVAGMLLNFFRGSSFPEIATYALFVLMPLFALLSAAVGMEPMLYMNLLIKALVLIVLAAITMGTIAVAFATKFDVVANLTLCTLVFFLGLVSSYLFQRQTDLMTLNAIFGFLYAVLPNWQYFWLADAVAVNRPIPVSYVLGCLGYVVIYITICTAWTVAVFQNKEVAGDGRGI